MLLQIMYICKEALSHLNIGPTLVPPKIVSVAFEDNRGALLLANNHRLTGRTKYYHVNCHWFWTHVKDGTFHVEGISSHLQNADYLTKPLPLESYAANRNRVQGF